MKTLIFSSLLLVSYSNLNAECVPARTVVKYPDDLENVGMYHRVHPSGNYVLASAATGGYSNTVAIIDLTGKENGKTKAKAISTPMIDETYPVEGKNWSLFASPNHDDGMRYFKFDDIKKDQTETKPIMNDAEHNQYYHSAAELPGSTAKVYKFRTMLWQGSRYRDYSITYNPDGSVKNVEKTETKTACGKTLSSPILSKDATEVASLGVSGEYPRTTKIFKIKEDGTCELVDDLGYATSKVSFSYPKPGKKGQITFSGQATIMVNGVPEASSGVFIYDRDTKTTRRLSISTDQNPSYPGMTEDGRVVYVNQDTREIITVDPNQLNDDGSEKSNKAMCIKKAGAVSTGAKKTDKKQTTTKQSTAKKQ